MGSLRRRDGAKPLTPIGVTDNSKLKSRDIPLSSYQNFREMSRGPNLSIATSPPHNVMPRWWLRSPIFNPSFCCLTLSGLCFDWLYPSVRTHSISLMLTTYPRDFDAYLIRPQKPSPLSCPVNDCLNFLAPMRGELSRTSLDA